MNIPDDLVRQAAGTDTLAAELRAEMSAIAARLHARADGLSSQVQVLTGQVDGLDGRIDGLSGRVDGLDARVLALEPQPIKAPAQPLPPAVVPWHHATWPVVGTDLPAITSGLPGVRINQAGAALTGGVPILAVLAPERLSIRHAGPHGHYVARWPRQPAAGDFWGISYELTNEVAQTDREEHMGCLCEQGHIHFVHTAILPARGNGDLAGGAWYHGLRRLYFSHAPGDVRHEARASVLIAGGQTVIVQNTLEWLSADEFLSWPRLIDKATGTILARPEDYVLTDQSNARLVDWYAQGRRLRRNTANLDRESIRDVSVGAAQNDGNPSGARYHVGNLRLADVRSATDWLA